MDDKVCGRCGQPTAGTLVHLTMQPIHVPCAVHGSCYVLCEDGRAAATRVLAGEGSTGSSFPRRD